MPAESDEPLRRCTLNLYRSDVAFLERTYGRGWTEKVRDLVRDYTRRSSLFKSQEPPYVK